MAPLVSFKNIQKTYDGKELIVKNLNLTVEDGEFLTLLGPSGSGKTTSLMMLAGFESPTSGEIWLNDRSIQNVPAHKRDIGVVFQNYALFPHMTVEENIGFPLSIRKVRGSERSVRIRKAMQMVKLDGMLKRYPAQLSGGQRQRVALARALVFEPKLMLMDEPLGALDKQLREHMQLEIKHLHQELGLTIVYVTHDQGEALTMSDRVAIFNDGVIQQISDPHTIYEDPKTKFVANFVGENNRISAKYLSGQPAAGTFQLISGELVQAKFADELQPGQGVDLYVRPERISLSAEEPNAVKVLVKERIYLGNYVRLVTTTSSGEIIVVQRTATEMSASIDVGSHVFIAWDGKFARTLLS